MNKEFEAAYVQKIDSKKELGSKIKEKKNHYVSEKEQLKIIDLMEKNHFKIIHQKTLWQTIIEDNNKKLEVKETKIFPM